MRSGLILCVVLSRLALAQVLDELLSAPMSGKMPS